MKIRKLNTQDFWSIIRILRKGGKEALSKLKESEDMSDMERGMLLFDIGMEYAETELTKLFASVANMTIEDYKNSEFDTTLSIIEQLNENENLGDFFKRAANIAKSFSRTSKPIEPIMK